MKKFLRKDGTCDCDSALLSDKSVEPHNFYCLECGCQYFWDGKKYLIYERKVEKA